MLDVFVVLDSSVVYELIEIVVVSPGSRDIVRRTLPRPCCPA
jgi:hypothetical protein